MNFSQSEGPSLQLF